MNLGAGADREGNSKGLKGIGFRVNADIKGKGEGVICQWRGSFLARGLRGLLQKIRLHTLMDLPVFK